MIDGVVGPDTEPTLLPTPLLEPGPFEDFTDRLLSAHRFCVGPVRKVVEVERWGRRGDGQQGVDLVGKFSDGATAAWQCKRYAKLTPADVRGFVSDCSYPADKYYLVCSGEASASVRAEIAKHPHWALVDRRGLGRMLDELPLHKKRDVLDQTWGSATRKRLLKVPGEDAFLSLAAFTEARENPLRVPNDCGLRVGRQSELRDLDEVLDVDESQPAVVLVTGPGGRGKTRLLVEALTAFEAAHPEVPVLFASAGYRFDRAALGELPQTPAVVVVDDAHQDPEALAPLLAYAETVPGTQLVLGVRPSGAQVVRAQVATARFSPADVREVVVGELSKREATALVASLTEGLDVPWTGRAYFANQAVHSPLVAVVAAHLIRRGELTAPLAVDAGLRGQVLTRYQELALDDIDVPARRVLAVYAALGNVVDDDEEVRAHIARFCGLDPVVVLRWVAQLRDRGVLVSHHGGTQVTPDVLADYVLEQESVADGRDTGFARQLWQSFGERHAGRLVTELAELDWRLRRQDGPSVFASVWESVRAEIGEADLDGVARALSRISGLAVTQPHLLIDVLEAVRARPDTSATDDLRAQRVRSTLADLYGKCATTDPDLLETALDALWSLRCLDSRFTNSNTNRAERVITDELANLGTLRHASFPNRILGRVEMWLAEPKGVESPLFAVKPFLEKDGHRAVQEARLKLGFRTYHVSTSWARPVRDHIRTILLTAATGDDLGRAGDAVRLLAVAIRPPQGGFGDTPLDDEVLGWEDDDLATIVTLTEVASGTGSPVIRRLVRESVAWTAERAKSLHLRHAALVLVTRLDDHGDDLAQLVVDTVHSIGTRKTAPVPTIEELHAADLARAADAAGLDDRQRREHDLRRARRRREDKQAQVEALTARVVETVGDDGGLARLVRDLDDLLRQVRLAAPARGVTPLLLCRFADLRPTLTSDLVHKVASGPPGPLDQHLPSLLCRWADSDESAFTEWLAGFDNRRHEVREAVADAFVMAEWATRPGTFRDVHRKGSNDPDPALRDRFLLGAHPLLAANPAAVAPHLLRAGITSLTTQRLLEHASEYDGAQWGQGLGREAALAVLDLVDHCGWSDYLVQQIAGGVADTHPELVLDRLAALAETRDSAPYDSDGIPDAFDRHSDVLAGWLVTTAVRSPVAAYSVAGVVMSHGMTENQARSLDHIIETVDTKTLAALACALNVVEGWPLYHPRLADRVFSAARLADRATADTIRQQVTSAMRPSHWGWSGGVSEELNRYRAAADEALTGEYENDDLRHAVQATRDWLDDEIRGLAARYDELENE
ncbi:restriction endonuclease [Actinophytocola gossypii]|uniref:Restriction endonuclease n=1 Tax=Actinophytocola gossypii TaxID=2812003 RepID=A0ABT2JJX3_9PSEU|nr:restriction endonuclease [Actinophytocola gossypii]MCT2587559.1 restriction endonuclease [Actinophytocola gossypii]